MKQGTQNYYYLYDGKGNVSAVIDSDEAIVASYRYDAFGNLISSPAASTLDQPFRFSTKRYDADTGLYYYGYRYYSPLMGKWITRNPIGEDGGINLYGFVGNSPMNFLDPYGLDELDKLGRLARFGEWFGNTAGAIQAYCSLEKYTPIGEKHGENLKKIAKEINRGDSARMDGVVDDAIKSQAELYKKGADTAIDNF